MRPWLSKTRAVILAVALGAFAAQAADTKLVGQSEVLAYLDQLMEWQRTAVAIDPAMANARERIFRDSLQQNATHVLQSGFTFARTEAALLERDTPDTDTAAPADGANATPSSHQKLQQRVANTDNQIASLTKQRAAMKSATKQRQDIDDQLKLANARKELLQAILANVNAASNEGSKGLLNKIDNLARSIPELNTDGSRPAGKAAVPASDAPSFSASAMIPLPMPAPPAAPVAADPDSTANRTPSTIIGLAATVFDVTRKQTELNAFMTQTTQLENTSHALMKPLRDALDNPALMGDGSAGAKAAAPANGQAAPPPLTIDQRVAAYKQMGAAIVPLGEATLWIGISKRTVAGWQDVLDHELKTYSRQLVIRLIILAFTLAIPLVASSMAHRAITRYVADPKRKRQLNTARRIVAALVILIILLLTFISDFSSFATFAGFLTAGLAVALQSVLLALVAHFLFYGRYGVRAGDRVNVAGVTGEIMQIGMVRFYLRELRDDGKGGLEPTGKVVAFPNSILFQPAAFYKYV